MSKHASLYIHLFTTYTFVWMYDNDVIPKTRRKDFIPRALNF